MKKYVFKSNFFKFVDDLATKKMIESRPIMVENSNDVELNSKFKLNELADSLHPKSHDLKITNIEVIDKDTKRFTLVPQNNKAAFFRAGQYLSISFNIDNYLISRPYSLCSSPLEAKLLNYYQIIVKRKPNGYVSNYILSKLKVGDIVKSTEPFGEFHYSFLRDSKHVVAIAGGSGITPFMSMAKAIVEGSENFKLTILNGNRKKENIILENELKELERRSLNRVKVVNILSDQKLSGYEHGFIDKNIIRKYCNPNESSFFICGPKIMYGFMEKNFDELKIDRKFIRFEASNDIGDPTSNSDYPKDLSSNKFKITVKTNNKIFEIPAINKETVLVSLQKSKIKIMSNCLSGKCSWCRARLIKGNIYSPKGFAHLRTADKINNFFYTCSAFPISDLEIEIL